MFKLAVRKNPDTLQYFTDKHKETVINKLRESGMSSGTIRNSVQTLYEIALSIDGNVLKYIKLMNKQNICVLLH
jgi:hypothetical protein